MKLINQLKNSLIDHITEGQKLYLLRNNSSIEEVFVEDINFHKDFITVTNSLNPLYENFHAWMLNAEGRSLMAGDNSQAYLEKPTLPKQPKPFLIGRRVKCDIFGEGVIFKVEFDSNYVVVEFGSHMKMYDLNGHLRDSTLNILN